jgi:XTP/dITP diphosphohydrolase
MKKLVFATNNQHKLEEVRAVLADKLEIVSLNELGCFDDIPETADTLEGNALIKAQYIYEKFGLDCFADDTGLEVDALGGEPGVYSARYAGEDSNARNNMHKLLKNLGENSNRTAHFRTVIALIEGEEIRYFEGKINGEIAYEPRGDAGFGYDPIFIPEGYDISFAEIGANVKNTISHRALAVGKLTEYLKQ